ncbi:glycosyltransferase family 2 protein, partial [Halobacterium salinarum]
MDDPRESVSVIVPVYNDPNGILQTLGSVAHQCSSHVEILVVDNGSTDDTSKTLQKYTAKHDNVRLLVENDIQGSYAARNNGIKHAQGNILAFLDADETVNNGWLGNALEAVHRHGVDYLGCNVELTCPENTLVGRYNARTGFPVEQYLEEQNYAPTCALLVRRAVFEDVGPFDAR